MVNEATISPLPLLYFYLSLLILIIIVTTTTIYPSLTLIHLYLLTFPPPSFLLFYENPFVFSHSYLIYLPSTLPFLFPSALSSSFLFYSFLSFEGFSTSSVRPYRQGLVVLLERPSGESRS